MRLRFLIPAKPLVDFLEEPTQFTKFINDFFGGGAHYYLRGQDKGVFKHWVMYMLSLNALKHIDQIPDNFVFINLSRNRVISHIFQVI